MPKKNNPGCLCCGAEDCTTRCAYKCQTPPCVYACALKIETPEPDNVNTADGPTCPPQECEITAKCNACKRIFDGVLRLFSLEGSPIWSLTQSVTDNCNDILLTYSAKNDEGSSYEATWFCWTYFDYLCPDESELYLIPNPCGPQYILKDPQIIVHITYDGSCSTTEVELKYIVAETCNSLAIPPENFLLDPETEYTHLYRRSNQCDCDEILGSVDYVSTTSANNARGITVPDVCNLDSAMVSIVDQTNCSCSCFYCQEPSSQRTLTATGDYAGTYLLNFVATVKDPYCIDGITDVYCNRFCKFQSALFGDNLRWILYIECLPCEKFNIYLVLEGLDYGFLYPLDNFHSYARALGVDCDVTISLDEKIEEGATFDLS